MNPIVIQQCWIMVFWWLDMEQRTGLTTGLLKTGKINNITTCTGTVHVQYMYSTCTVHVQYMYSTCVCMLGDYGYIDTIHFICIVINLHNLEKRCISFTIKCLFGSNLVLNVVLKIK